jgi:CheY-like chemotaxis protein
MDSNKILVIDDEQSIRDSYQSILCRTDYDALTELVELFGEITEEQDERPNYSVSFADQGLAGIELAQAAFNAGEPFAIAFIDMRMPPGIDGLETAKRLRAIDSKIQIIFVTAYSDRSLQELDQALGFDMLLLNKPFTSDEVLQLARNSLRNWNHVRQLEWDLAQSDQQAALANDRADFSEHIMDRVNASMAKVQDNLNQIRKAQEQVKQLNERLEIAPKSQDQDRVRDILQEALRGYNKHAISADLTDASVTLKQMSALIARQRQRQYGTADIKISLHEAVEEALLVFSDRLARSNLKLNLHLEPEVSDTLFQHPRILQLLNTLLFKVIEGVEMHDLEIDADDHGHIGKGRSIMVSADIHATREQFLEMFVSNDNLNSMHNNAGKDMSATTLSSDESGLRHAVLFVNDLSGNIRHYENPENTQDQSFQVCLPIVQ